MNHNPFRQDCPKCQRGFFFTHSGEACTSCHLCCDCCTCNPYEFTFMQQEVRSLYSVSLATLSADDDSSTITANAETGRSFDSERFRKNMVKIAIWPYSMEDDEIVFDPETGHLTDEVAQKVEYYLSLNHDTDRSLKA